MATGRNAGRVSGDRGSREYLSTAARVTARSNLAPINSYLRLAVQGCPSRVRELGRFPPIPTEHQFPRTHSDERDETTVPRIPASAVAPSNLAPASSRGEGT